MVMALRERRFRHGRKGLRAVGFAAERVGNLRNIVGANSSCRPRSRAGGFNATRGLVGPYEIDFRILLGAEIRWISARGLGSDEGMHRGWMSGVFLDVTGRKQAEEGHKLLAGEMSHRVKNVLAIAVGLTTMTSRSSQNVQEMAAALTERLAAVGRAHSLVRPLQGTRTDAAMLGDRFTVLLAPYDEEHTLPGRIKVAVPRMAVGEKAATAIALVVHELATNSLKYGALSSESGMLDVSGTNSDTEVTIVWTERGGPPVKSRGSLGYGSKLLHTSLTGQLGGTIAIDWAEKGAIITLIMKTENLAF